MGGKIGIQRPQRAGGGDQDLIAIGKGDRGPVARPFRAGNARGEPVEEHHPDIAPEPAGQRRVRRVVGDGGIDGRLPDDDVHSIIRVGRGHDNVGLALHFQPQIRGSRLDFDAGNILQFALGNETA